MKNLRSSFFFRLFGFCFKILSYQSYFNFFELKDRIVDIFQILKYINYDLPNLS